MVGSAWDGSRPSRTEESFQPASDVPPTAPALCGHLPRRVGFDRDCAFALRPRRLRQNSFFCCWGVPDLCAAWADASFCVAARFRRDPLNPLAFWFAGGAVLIEWCNTAMALPNNRSMSRRLSR